MFKNSSLTKNKVVAFIANAIGAEALFFFAQLVALTCIVIALQVSGNSAEEVEELLTSNIAVQLVAITLVATLSVYFVRRLLLFFREKPKKFLLLERVPKPKELGEVFVIYGLYFLTLVVVVIGINIFNEVVSPGNPLIDTNQAQDLGITASSGAALLAAFFMLVIIPPIYEEILFRGYLFNRLKKYSSTIVAGLVTSILFGIAHLEFSNLNWIAAIDTLIFSGFLIYISQKHKSLYSAMLLHAIKNSIAFYVLFVR